MIDLPETRDMIGPAQIQQILRDIEWLKDCVRSQKLMDSPTVRVNEQSHGTFLEASPAAAPAPTADEPRWS
jgi:hypothetical protein